MYLWMSHTKFAEQLARLHSLGSVAVLAADFVQQLRGTLLMQHASANVCARSTDLQVNFVRGVLLYYNSCTYKFSHKPHEKLLSGVGVQEAANPKVAPSPARVTRTRTDLSSTSSLHSPALRMLLPVP